jgi:lipoyl(octanoyl) transferase
VPDGWRLVLGSGTAAGLVPTRGARNMAVDHALLETVQAGGQPVLRLYRWQPACLSFGRHQHACGVYDEARLRAGGIDAVRRPTGGLAVLHDRELTYCVLVPAERLGGARAAYRMINRSLVDGLRRLGVPAVLAGSATPRDPRRDSAQPCFHAPAEGEVVAGGRKLVGSAQRAERRTLLQHGSILLDGSQQDVLRLLCAPPAEARGTAVAAAPDELPLPAAGSAAGPAAATLVAAAPASITLSELLGAVPSAAVLTAAIVAGFENVCGTRLAPALLTCEESARADQLEATYGSAAWTWRR